MRTGWNNAKLGEICQLIKRGIAPKYTDAGGICVINQKCIRDHRVNLDLSRRHDMSSKKVNPERIVRRGDVLVNSTGTGTLGRVAQVRGEFQEPTTVDTHVTIVRPIEGLLYPPFFGYMMILIENQIISGGEGASGQTELPRTKLENDFLVTYPDSIDEQERIVAILDEAFAGIDTAIANTQKNLANARELFESYLNAIYETPPSHWTEARLGDICKIKHGFAFKSEYFSTNGDYVVLTPGSFWENGGFRHQGKKTKYYTEEPPVDFILKKGDFLVAMTEQAVGLLGSSLIVPESNRYLHNQRLGLVQVNDDFNWHNDFFFHQFNTQAFRSAVQSTASGVKVRHTSPGKLGDIPVKFPSSEEEQISVSDKLNSLLDETCRLESMYKRKLTALSELKQSLLQKAFSGELTADNVVPINSAKKANESLPTDSPAFTAHIMAAALHWHESQGKNKTFGHVKAQKTLHLVEALARIDLGRKPIKDAAGPNDFAHMGAAEQWARDNDFYEFVQRSEGRRGYDFVKGRRYDEWLPKALDAVAPYQKALDRVVNLLMPLDTRQAELVATAYAAWNNLLLDGTEPAEDDIIREARDNWHPDKLQYTKPQFREAIAKLRSHGMVPTGSGKRVTGQESFEL